MIRYANAYDLYNVAQLLDKLFESENYKTVTHDLNFVLSSLAAVLPNPDVDLIVSENNGVIDGAACAAAQDTFLCPDVNYYEQFVVSDNPMNVRYMLKFLKKRKVERGCKRFIVGVSTSENPRYESLLKRMGFTSFGKTLKLE